MATLTELFNLHTDIEKGRELLKDLDNQDAPFNSQKARLDVADKVQKLIELVGELKADTVDYKLAIDLIDKEIDYRIDSCERGGWEGSSAHDIYRSVALLVTRAVKHPEKIFEDFKEYEEEKDERIGD